MVHNHRRPTIARWKNRSKLLKAFNDFNFNKDPLMAWFEFKFLAKRQRSRWVVSESTSASAANRLRGPFSIMDRIQE
ncbi:hypothetical protein KIN20_022325 [Parelaphostrongylus tenuis]|uniref:Uncharacterized protein n=1 Tax=Parelaphostrongylus tenuis TaxID=148309 RepID=A0AAD5N622_PARTN|nr:hypothetical protein KIN20_022325 [Parelaphostrongylus tenuis]